MTVRSDKMEILEGYVDFHVPDAGADCRTWYRIYQPVLDDDACGGAAPTYANPPLVILHGGPGIPHNYIEPLKKLASILKAPIVFYDQLGCGHSTHLKHKTGDEGAAFWKPELFLSELDNLLTSLGISHNYDLLGQSWGGMLATMHAIRQPAGLRRLILCNTPASVKLFMDATQKLRDQLPKETQEILDKGERDREYEDPHFKKAIIDFYLKHVCRLPEFPPELMESMGAVEEDNTVYMTMNGPSEFIVTGTLQSFDTREECHKINRPTLLLNGRYDEVTDETVAPLFSRIDKVKWYSFAESSHMPWFEEPELFYEIVSSYLLAA